MAEPTAAGGDLVQLNTAVPAELRRAIHLAAAHRDATRQAVVCTILADALGVPLPQELRVDGLGPTPATQPSCNCPAPCPN